MVQMHYRAMDTNFRRRGIRLQDTVRACHIFQTTNCRPAGTISPENFPRKFQLGSDMNRLTREEADPFLSRFYYFYDALLKQIEVIYEPDGERILIVSLGARDATENQVGGWVSVTMRFDNVIELNIREHPNQTLQVLSNGLHLSWFGPTLGVDFGSLVDIPKSLPELQTSECFAVCDSISWEVGSY